MRTKKQSERISLNECLKSINNKYPDLLSPVLPDKIMPEEQPNFIIEDGTIKIGVEITNFYLKDGALPESEQYQRAFCEKIVSEAQRTYNKESSKKIEIDFCFDEIKLIDKNTKTELIKKAMSALIIDL